MATILEARDLSGPVSAAPACVRLAPPPADVADLLHDESRLAASGVASVAEPGTMAELRQVMRWHAAEGHRVTVSGARTGVTGGAVPDPSTHLVSVARLRGVVELDLHASPPYVRALAGTTLRELQGQLATRAPGWTLPLDPTEAGASLGGMVATNAAGSRCFRFGATRDWVVGLTVELASGRTLELRRGTDRAEGDAITLQDGDDRRTTHLPAIPKPRTKNSIGYGFAPGGDVVDLFIGSEGTLGVVSEVTLRLAPAVESRLAFLQCFATPAQAFALVEALRGDGALRTTAVEFLDARSHELARETGKPEVERVLANAPAGSCSVFAEFGYDDEVALEATIERVLAHVAAAGGDEAAGLAGIDDQVLKRHPRLPPRRARAHQRHHCPAARAAPDTSQDRHRHGGGGQGPALGLRPLHHPPHRGRARPRGVRPRREQPLPRQHPAQGRRGTAAGQGDLR